MGFFLFLVAVWPEYTSFIRSSAKLVSGRYSQDEHVHASVELEKSNVLLMGPTGSGMIYLA